MIHHRRETCRICGGKDLTLFLSLGPTPLANAFLKNRSEFASESIYPLDVYFCETCSLVQLLDVIDPEILFRHYIYVTGTSETISEHNMLYARSIIDYGGLRPEDLVVEAASNDGSLLRCFKENGVRTLGIEPARNLADLANGVGIDTVCTFFNSNSAESIRNSFGAAKVVIGNNVLAHVDDPRDFLVGCRRLLRKDGMVVIEVPYIKELVSRLEYDTIYHEHLCYFSVTTLMALCESVELSVARMDKVSVHGGSLRMYAMPTAALKSHSKQVLSMACIEIEEGLTKIHRYRKLATDIARNRDQILNLLTSLKDDAKTLAGYGAPAKGNTLLNYCGIDSSLLPYTVDKNPMKVGLFSPGMHIPVLPVSALLDNRPDYLLILAWNFAEEIMRQQREYSRQGGRFIIPIPEPVLL